LSSRLLDRQNNQSMLAKQHAMTLTRFHLSNRIQKCTLMNRNWTIRELILKLKRKKIFNPSSDVTV